MLLALGDSVMSNESRGIVVEVGEKVSFFIDKEKMLILIAVVVMTLDGTPRRGTMVGDDAYCDFVPENTFNLWRKISDKDFSISDALFFH